MVSIWIRKLTGATWPVALQRVSLWLALGLLIGALTPAAVAALGKPGLAQSAGMTTASTPAAQPTTYRYAVQPDGTTQVQRSRDEGRTWPSVGMIPDQAAQLAVNPANDTVVIARTGTSLWRSGDSGLSWARLNALPDRPLTLAFAGSSDPSGLIFAGTAARGLYSSLDSGATWQAAGGPLSPMGPGALAVTALAVNPGDQHVAYAAATFSLATPEGSHSVQSVFISVDDGRRWFAMTPAPRFQQAITQLMPRTGALLGVLILGPFGAQVVNLAVDTTLISGLDDPDAGIRAATARALGLAHDRSLLPVLLQHMNDVDLLAGNEVAQAIGRLGDPAAVPLLLRGLSDTDEVIRARAAMALGLLRAPEAIPQLNTMLQLDGPWGRQHAAEALAAIGTPAAMAALIRPLQDAEVTPVRFMAMHGLEPAGRAAVTPLRLALLDRDPVVRRNAAEMLGGLRATDAVPDLVQSLSDQDFAVRTQAHRALGEMHSLSAQLALSQGASREAGRPMFQTINAARDSKQAPGMSAQQGAAVLPVSLAGAFARFLPGRSTLAELAILAGLAILAALLIWKRPRQQPLKPCEGC